MNNKITQRLYLLGFFTIFGSMFILYFNILISFVGVAVGIVISVYAAKTDTGHNPYE